MAMVSQILLFFKNDKLTSALARARAPTAELSKGSLKRR
ncbi:hypothetical protein ACVIOG_007356 [Rhizobium leguminosarum]